MCSTQLVEGMHSKLKPDLDRYTLISEMMPRMKRLVSRIQDQFESDGIPCCHIFCVMKDQLVCKYPESLEKEHWKKPVGDSTMAPCFKVPVDNKAA
ncbi:hypothetical protein ACLB2K_032149 [Fragaria x ananassa]